MRNCSLIYTRNPEDLRLALYNESDLRQLRKSFGHPKVRTTVKLLERAAGGTILTNMRESIQNISKDCETCRVSQNSPKRIKLTVGSEDFHFNHRLQVNTMVINGKPVVHFVDEATYYTAACYPRSKSTGHVSKAIREL